jgi:hypothetical protein
LVHWLHGHWSRKLLEKIAKYYVRSHSSVSRPGGPRPAVLADGRRLHARVGRTLAFHPQETKSFHQLAVEKLVCVRARKGINRAEGAQLGVALRSCSTSSSSSCTLLGLCRATGHLYGSTTACNLLAVSIAWSSARSIFLLVFGFWNDARLIDCVQTESKAGKSSIYTVSLNT